MTNNVTVLLLQLFVVLVITTTAINHDTHKEVEISYGLSSRAVPSLALIGMAKCGTTKTTEKLLTMLPGLSGVSWDLTPYHGTKECHLMNIGQYDARLYEARLTCPKTRSEELSIQDCVQYRGNATKAPKYSFAGNPNQLVFPTKIASSYRSYYQERKHAPLFLLTLREPFVAMQSLYDYFCGGPEYEPFCDDPWMFHKIVTFELRLLLDPEQKKEIELLSDITIGHGYLKLKPAFDALNSLITKTRKRKEKYLQLCTSWCLEKPFILRYL